MSQEPETARDIAVRMLEKTGGALMSGDFETFYSCFELPQMMETFSGRMEIKDKAALETLFRSVVKQLETSGATDMVRRVIECKFRDPDTIVTTHETRLMRGAYLMRAPYPAYGTLRRIDGVWKITDSVYAIEDIDDFYSDDPISPSDKDLG